MPLQRTKPSSPGLCVCDDATFLPWRTWTEIAAMPTRERVVVVVPIAGFADHGEELPLDVEECVLMAVLREALMRCRRTDAGASAVELLVTPPLRFVTGSAKGGAFTVESPVAHAFIDEVCASLAASGFRKIVLCNASEWNEALCDVAARDIRVERGLQMFCVNLSALGVRVADVGDGERLERAGGRMAGLLEEIARRGAGAGEAGDVRGGKRRGEATVGTIRSGEATVVQTAVHTEVDPPLAGRTVREITALPEKERAVVLVTTGAVEQHGPHLPLAFDALMGQVWVKRIWETLPEDVRCYVAPPITIGKSNEHTGFPGTLMISKETLRSQLHAIVRQVKAWGFRRIAILNTHGGNTSVLRYVAREMEESFGVEVTLLEHGAVLEPPLSAQEATYGFHAGELETSWLLAVAPERVRQGRAVCEYPARVEDAGELRAEAAPATFAWMTRDVSVSGVMGDATAATAEKGARWIEQIVAGYVGRIVALCGGTEARE